MRAAKSCSRMMGRSQGDEGDLQRRIAILARPERLELPTLGFEDRYSIQLSYGRADCDFNSLVATPGEQIRGETMLRPPICPRGAAIPLSRGQQARHRVIDRLGAFVLVLVKEMRIDRQRDRRVRVAEPFGDFGHVDAGVDQMTPMRMPKRVKADAVERWRTPSAFRGADFFIIAVPWKPSASS